MSSADWVWGGLLAAGGVYEAVALINRREGDTLSETTRKAFRVRTTGGKIAFGALWISFSSWFLGHILWGWPFPGS